MYDGWNPWHGCRKISAGCLNCYVYRRDGSVGRDASDVHKTASFDLPVRRKRDGRFSYQPRDGLAYTCFTSDFFLEEADEWRTEAWQMIRERWDLHFSFITKRIHRFYDCIPEDWGEWYPNVSIGCTTENQDRADFRLPIFLNAPIASRYIILEPLLGPVDIRPYLTSAIGSVTAGGESGDNARPCRYEWVLDLREQCVEAGIRFHFKQTGANFIKDGKQYRIPRKLQHALAKKAGIDYPGNVS